jgi:hypothetical protein
MGSNNTGIEDPRGLLFQVFLPEDLGIRCAVGRSSGSFRLGRLPISPKRKSGILDKVLGEHLACLEFAKHSPCGTYSNGDCSGFAPDSLLSLV